MKAHDRLTTKKSDLFPHASTAPLQRATAGSSCSVSLLGGRISELLTLQIGDVYQNGKPVIDLLLTNL